MNNKRWTVNNELFADNVWALFVHRLMCIVHRISERRGFYGKKEDFNYRCRLRRSDSGTLGG